MCLGFAVSVCRLLHNTETDFSKRLLVVADNVLRWFVS